MNSRRFDVCLLSGEAFFEVAHDAEKPFYVEAGNILVEDVGTSFNINSYNDEPAINTTLIEGSIKLYADAGKTQLLIKPGQQASFSNNEITLNNAVDIGAVIAWKNHQFRFVNTPVQSIMNELQRWYDIEVVYEDTVDVHLNATIERNTPLSKLLKLLSTTEEVHFRIEGHKIYVNK